MREAIDEIAIHGTVRFDAKYEIDTMGYISDKTRIFLRTTYGTGVLEGQDRFFEDAMYFAPSQKGRRLFKADNTCTLNKINRDIVI